jgi:hypothetical protein
VLGGLSNSSLGEITAFGKRRSEWLAEELGWCLSSGSGSAGNCTSIGCVFGVFVFGIETGVVVGASLGFLTASTGAHRASHFTLLIVRLGQIRGIHAADFGFPHRRSRSRHSGAIDRRRIVVRVEGLLVLRNRPRVVAVNVLAIERRRPVFPHLAVVSRRVPRVKVGTAHCIYQMRCWMVLFLQLLHADFQGFLHFSENFLRSFGR